MLGILSGSKFFALSQEAKRGLKKVMLQFFVQFGSSSRPDVLPCQKTNMHLKSMQHEAMDKVPW